MRPITSILFLFLSLAVVGQSKYPNKTEVLKVINLAIRQKPNQNNNSCEYGLCGEWWIINKDSGFYKTDTLRLFNSSNIANSVSDHCPFIVWDFNNENIFSQTKADMCTEPPERTIGNINDSVQKSQPNRFEIVEDGNTCFINIYVDKKLFDSYKVFDLVKTTDTNLGNHSFVLSLLRQRP